ncbi:unnamed protein product [Phytophthora lilii]|uniref:Unnamed protein product n=1 Tax=Phytophthora lilii TaxID=2077276 RepID=A0A9W7CT18_9STRA|nr:unnamed protein product [Phytophthora lilii]
MPTSLWVLRTATRIFRRKAASRRRAKFQKELADDCMHDSAGAHEPAHEGPQGGDPERYATQGETIIAAGGHHGHDAQYRAPHRYCTAHRGGATPIPARHGGSYPEDVAGWTFVAFTNTAFATGTSDATTLTLAVTRQHYAEQAGAQLPYPEVHGGSQADVRTAGRHDVPGGVRRWRRRPTTTALVAWSDTRTKAHRSAAGNTANQGNKDTKYLEAGHNEDPRESSCLQKDGDFDIKSVIEVPSASSGSPRRRWRSVRSGPRSTTCIAC